MFLRRSFVTTIAVAGLVLAGCSQGEDSQAQDNAAAPAPVQEQAAPQQQAEAAAPMTADWSLPGASSALPQTTAEILSERSIGSPDAPITIIEYSSLTCPHCANLHKTVLPRLKTEMIDTGKVRLVFQDFPLGGLAMAASLMARCAPPKNYFKLITALFHDQMTWARAENPLEALTGTMMFAGLPKDRALECLQNAEAKTGMEAWMNAATQNYGVDSTPTLIVNGEKVNGIAKYEDLAAILDRHMK